MPNRPDVKGSAVLLGILLSWSTAPLFIRQFFREGITIWDQNFWRFAWLLLWLWITVWLRFRKTGFLHHFNRRVWLLGLIPALANLGGQIFYPWSVYFAEPGMMSLLQKQYIIWAVLLGVLFHREERRLFQNKFFWIGLFCAVSGSLGVILFQQKGGFHTQMLGILFVTIGAISWAGYALGIRIITRSAAPLVSYTVVTTYSIIGLLVLSFCLGKPLSLIHQTGRIHLLILVSTLFNLYLPHMGLYWVIQRMGVMVTQTALLGTAFFTAIFSWLIFSEQLTAGQWLSGVILVLGAALTLFAQERLHAVPEPELV